MIDGVTRVKIDIAPVLGWMEQATAIARGYAKGAAARRKADRTWVTEADTTIEAFFVGQIRAAFPGHAILGEETGRHAGSADYLWAIDPIDGTQSFMQGLPGWSISLGLIANGRPLLGFVSVPCSEELYWVEPGAGARCNGEPITVRESADVARDDWVAATSRAHRSFQITFPGKLRSYGSIATHLCYVARDAAVACLLGGAGRGGLWDVAAGVAILQAAGGALFTLDGAPIPPATMADPAFVEPPMIACAPAVLPRLLPSFRPMEEG